MNGPRTTEGYALSSDSFDIESGLCGWGKLHLAYQAGVYCLASNSVGDGGICPYDENDFAWIQCTNVAMDWHTLIIHGALVADYIVAVNAEVNKLVFRKRFSWIKNTCKSKPHPGLFRSTIGANY
jgi:hypothetical protein